jgi:hypothetical protein
MKLLTCLDPELRSSARDGELVMDDGFTSAESPSTFTLPTLLGAVDLAASKEDHGEGDHSVTKGTRRFTRKSDDPAAGQRQ